MILKLSEKIVEEVEWNKNSKNLIISSYKSTAAPFLGEIQDLKKNI